MEDGEYFENIWHGTFRIWSEYSLQNTKVAIDVLPCIGVHNSTISVKISDNQYENMAI